MQEGYHRALLRFECGFCDTWESQTHHKQVLLLYFMTKRRWGYYAVLDVTTSYVLTAAPALRQTRSAYALFTRIFRVLNLFFRTKSCPPNHPHICPLSYSKCLLLREESAPFVISLVVWVDLRNSSPLPPLPAKILWNSRLHVLISTRKHLWAINHTPLI